MTRRENIKQLFLLLGSSLLFPSCFEVGGLISSKLLHIKLTVNQENIFIDYIHNLIPSTETYGAKELKLDAFILKMFDDLYSEIEQKKLKKGFNELEKVYEKSITINASAKKSFYKNLNKSQLHNQELQFFLNETYKWALIGYQDSEYVMTKLIPYELVPGHYYGCVNIKA
ncbi:hypothetical protein A5893_02405 [Pedobacter psychrophilus]|uniref:Gluconate 2-dehydrogenase subunit 3 family protein n=2 Tax=Pedobacter psychrophilus TaxID=1826909 RepID=A0A179DMG1_9SPHI|nr:hypothetical protein A5893_02405 [Pedobacter psychrophilus]